MVFHLEAGNLHIFLRHSGLISCRCFFLETDDDDRCFGRIAYCSGRMHEFCTDRSVSFKQLIQFLPINMAISKEFRIENSDHFPATALIAKRSFCGNHPSSRTVGKGPSPLSSIPRKNSPKIRSRGTRIRGSLC